MHALKIAPDTRRLWFITHFDKCETYVIQKIHSIRLLYSDNRQLELDPSYFLLTELKQQALNIVL